jgi:serine/threonine protein kinase
MPREITVGDKVGRYQLLEQLGRGGMAVVFRARDPKLDRDVAIKIMHAHLWSDPEAVARFEREARAAAGLSHPNIVDVYDYGTVGGKELAGAQDEQEGAEDLGSGDDPVGYIVVELLRGPTLRQYVAKQGRLLPDVAALVALKLADALCAAHGRGIVHRDIKPDNVMIAEGGRLVLTDFGLARPEGGETVTQTGALLGSPAYVAPEQARGDTVDGRTDLFALGALLYELCCGRVPFLAKEPLATVLLILEGAYPPPGQQNPQIGRDLERVITRLLAPAPEDRYADASAAKGALEQLLAPLELGNADQALSRYFSEAGAFNRELVQRVVETSLSAAQQAVTKRDYPRALSLCDRVLAFEPRHEQALALMKTLSSRGGRGRLLMIAVALLLVFGGGGAVWALWLRGDHPPASSLSGSGGGTATAIGRSLVADAKLSLPIAADAGTDQQALVERGRDARAADDTRTRTGAPDARRPRRVVRRPRRRRDAGRGEPDARTAMIARRPDAGPPKPKPTHGQLLIAWGPWCKASIDGKPVGDSPMKKPLRLPAGTYKVACKAGPCGSQASKTVTVVAGKQTRIATLVTGPVRVTTQLSRGDALKLDSKSRPTSGFTTTAESHHVAVLKGGVTVIKGWVVFPCTGRCTLVDTPKLRCK